MDMGCGDFNWMSRIMLPQGVSYVGVDIVPQLIESNKKYSVGVASTKFFVSDIVETPPYKQFDVVLLRDVLTHLERDDIFEVIKNIKNSNSKYLLTTIYLKDFNNISIKNGEWHRINLSHPPYSFPKPLDIVEDQGDKVLALWKIEDIPL
eukprot:TRINITY_DN6191_c0_g1_i1.p1 TRINITY_DN6191_c0_g1~~TRINITY_DN6191_c0_g1_i1.p1  ORF type:complete len:150 (-),score=25.92 TRINITY_DN6191_c0_g1_i1:111-560(-)